MMMENLLNGSNNYLGFKKYIIEANKSSVMYIDCSPKVLEHNDLLNRIVYVI